MNLEEIQAFESDLTRDTTLTPVDRTTLRDKFFQQKIKTSPEWFEAPPDVRFKFAKQFGVSPGLAQQFEGEFYVRGGKPVTGEFGEGPFETGALPMPRGDIGEAAEPNMFLDPTTAMSGGAAALLAKAPIIGAILAARNPLIREAGRRGVAGSALDWQTIGLNRLPGFIGRKAGDIMQRFGGRGQMPQGQMGRPGPASGAPPPIPESPMAPPPIAGGSAPRPRFRYGPGGLEELPQ